MIILDMDEASAKATLEKLCKLQYKRKVRTTAEQEAQMIREDRRTH